MFLSKDNNKNEHSDYQIVSDIHLEFHKGNFPKVNQTSSNLILAGDIGVISNPHYHNLMENFIKHCCSRWTHVFFVMGNHEYYHCTDMPGTLDKLRRIIIEVDNFHILHSDYYILDDIAIYGFTGWTIPSVKIRRYGYDLCDFDEIKINNKNISMNDMERIAKEEIVKFKEFINKINNDEIKCKAVIVITHFPPIRIGTSDPKYLGDNLNDYFSWNNMLLSEEINCDKIRVWGSGHTHWSYDFIINGIRFIANQYGYPFERLSHTSGSFNVEIDN